MGKVLVIGQGAREHALCWRLHFEGHEVHVAPGNPGMESSARCHDVAVSDVSGQVALARRVGADLAIVGPEQPLVDGLADRLREAGVATLGPSARAAELEASKAAAKAFMTEFGIPTARSVTVTSLDEGLAALETFASPPVVKADGLAAGKGVTVCEDFDEAAQALRECLSEGRFGGAGHTVVLEERLFGQEVSLFVLSDGTRAAVFEPAQDHKRIGEGDTGPNTGGMGAYLPAPIFTEMVRERTMATIVEPTLAGLAAQGRPFVGVLFVGLMIGDDGEPRVIEYNCRLGDPEAQPLLFGLDAPIYDRFVAAATGRLSAGRITGRPSATVVLASAGYPESSRAGDVITGLDACEGLPDVRVFHAGTRRSGTHFETAGGRVLGVCARADDLGEAFRRAYEAVDSIHFDGMQARRDIGHRVR